MNHPLSATMTVQGRENTCFAHVIARLFLKNVFKIPNETEKDWKYESVCNLVLDTSRDIYVDRISKEECGTNGYLKICLFLYIFYLAKEFEEKRKGINKGGNVQYALTEITSKVNAKTVPNKFLTLP